MLILLPPSSFAELKIRMNLPWNRLFYRIMKNSQRYDIVLLSVGSDNSAGARSVFLHANYDLADTRSGIDVNEQHSNVGMARDQRG